jgi:hypothetical protein
MINEFFIEIEVGEDKLLFYAAIPPVAIKFPFLPFGLGDLELIVPLLFGDKPLLLGDKLPSAIDLLNY